MMTNNIHSDLPIPPGDYLQEVLEDIGMTQKALAQRMGRPIQAINEIIKGIKTITSETAIQLEMVTKVPASIWMGLEAEFQLTKAKIIENEKMQQEKNILKDIPIKDLIKEKLIPEVSTIEDKIIKIRQFFGVASLNSITEISYFKPAYRCSKKFMPHPLALVSWLRAAELQAQNTETNKFKKEELKKAVKKIRSMSLKTPDTFLKELERILAHCGVALVLLPHFDKTYGQGASFFVNANKAILLLSIRGKWADIFWFSLFHEIGHLLLHDKSRPYISLVKYAKDRYEKEADIYAADTLVPRDKLDAFIARKRFTRGDIVDFAEKVEIDPGIVAGRLQHENIIGKANHILRKQYEWV